MSILTPSCSTLRCPKINDLIRISKSTMLTHDTAKHTVERLAPPPRVCAVGAAISGKAGTQTNRQREGGKERAHAREKT